jgi:hypothetical protein
MSAMENRSAQKNSRVLIFAIERAHLFHGTHSHGFVIVFVVPRAAYPHVGLRALLGIAAEQERSGVQVFQVAANGHALDPHAARIGGGIGLVVEFHGDNLNSRE